MGMPGEGAGAFPAISRYARGAASEAEAMLSLLADMLTFVAVGQSSGAKDERRERVHGGEFDLRVHSF